MWYRKAAEQGYAEAQFRLGLAYGAGVGVPENLLLAVIWFSKAAAQGHVNAMEAMKKFGFAE